MDNKYFLPGAVVVAGLFIAGAVVWSGSHPSTPAIPGAPAPVALTAIAKSIAADVKANTATYQAMVDSDKAEAQKAGVDATPAFLIGKQVIKGAYPYVAFKTAIDNVISGKTAIADGSNGITVSKVDSKDIAAASNPFIGKADAPITIAFWSDFQCPYCKAFEVGGVPQIPTPAAFPDIIKNYVDTGKIKVVFMDFTFLGNDSVTAALYNHAVWKLYPDQYFAWRTAMYVAQDQEGDQGFGNADSIDQLDAKVLK